MSRRTANACYKDAADLHAELEEYPQAIALYEQVANGSLSSPLTKYSVKEYWLRARLCALAMGVSGIGSSDYVSSPHSNAPSRIRLPPNATCQSMVPLILLSLRLGRPSSSISSLMRLRVGTLRRSLALSSSLIRLRSWTTGRRAYC